MDRDSASKRYAQNKTRGINVSGIQEMIMSGRMNVTRIPEECNSSDHWTKESRDKISTNSSEELEGT